MSIAHVAEKAWDPDALQLPQPRPSSSGGPECRARTCARPGRAPNATRRGVALIGAACVAGALLAEGDGLEDLGARASAKRRTFGGLGDEATQGGAPLFFFCWAQRNVFLFFLPACERVACSGSQLERRWMSRLPLHTLPD